MRFWDEELLYLERQGCAEALIYLYILYERDIGILLNKTFYSKFRITDLVDCHQQASCCLEKAFLAYRNDRGCSLHTFASKSIRNRMISILNKDAKIKERFHKRSISLDQTCSQENSLYYNEVIEDVKDNFQPRSQMMVKELMMEYHHDFQERLSVFEQRVIQLRFQGYTYNEIAIELGVNIKNIYNAIYRIQRKIKRFR